jgi:hypothetical protein
MPSVRPPGPLAPLAAVALASAVAGCNGETLTLGKIAPAPYHFDPPQIVSELRSDVRTDNPTLTADLLEIVFTSERVSGNGDVWFARRASIFQPFTAPSPITEVNTDTFETSSAISADGLTLWFGSDRPGGVGTTDVWVSSRPHRAAPWTTPVNVVALNTTNEDIPRPPGQHGLVMPMASKPGGILGVYQTFFAERSSTGAPFGAPALVAELAYAERSTVDGFLTDDGLTLFFSSSPLQVLTDAGPVVDGGALPTADLFVAWRRTVNEEFRLTQPLDDLNTPGDERDPWLTPDSKTLYFTSDRDGALNIYTATVRPR